MINHPIFNVLPHPMQSCIGEIQRGTNLNADFLLGASLYAISVAIGNTYKIKVLNGWEQSPNLFMVIVGKTGASKTPAISTAMEPLYVHNTKLEIENERLYKEYKSLQKDEQKNVFEPPRKQLIIEDATMEAIYRIMHSNPRGIGLCFDEIIGFFKNMGRYNGGGEQQLWLKMWSGKDVLVNRANRENQFNIQKPNIGLIGGIQPKVIKDLYGDDRDKNGFLERILFVYPENAQKQPFPTSQASAESFAKYEHIINRLLALDMAVDDKGAKSSRVIHFTPEAKCAYQNFYNKSAIEVNQLGDDSPMSGFYNKVDSYCARFALLLQLTYWSCNEDSKDMVGIRAVEGAIVLCDYFMKNAEKVLNIEDNSKALTEKQKKHFAFQLSLRKGYNSRVIGDIFGVSHQTICTWIKEFSN